MRPNYRNLASSYVVYTYYEHRTFETTYHVHRSHHCIFVEYRNERGFHEAHRIAEHHIPYSTNQHRTKNQSISVLQMSQSDEITDHQIDGNIESHPEVIQGVVPKTKSNENNKSKSSLSVSTNNTEAPTPIRTPTNKKEDTKNCKPRNVIGSDKMAHKLLTENQPESIKTNRCKRCKTVCVLISVLLIIGSIGGIYWTYHNPVESMWIMFRIAFWINTYFPIETVTEEEDIDESGLYFIGRHELRDFLYISNNFRF